MNERQFRKLVAGGPGVSLDAKGRGRQVTSVDSTRFAMLNLPSSARSGHLHFKLGDRPGIMPTPHLARARSIAVAATAHHPPSGLAERLHKKHRPLAAMPSKRRQRELDLPAPEAKP